MLKIVIENATKIDSYIWQSNLNPSEIRFLGPSLNNFGSFSIISVPKDKISFSPDIVKVLNIGLTKKLLILVENEPSPMPLNEEKISLNNPGDQFFVERLPVGELEHIGASILSKVRKHFRGDLKYHDTSGKFIESPDNFWTVKIQPRDKSLRITVRGVPSNFHIANRLEIKPDMNGYSRFKVKREEEVEEAVKIILNAKKK